MNQQLILIDVSNVLPSFIKIRRFMSWVRGTNLFKQARVLTDHKKNASVIVNNSLKLIKPISDNMYNNIQARFISHNLLTFSFLWLYIFSSISILLQLQELFKLIKVCHYRIFTCPN